MREATFLDPDARSVNVDDTPECKPFCRDNHRLGVEATLRLHAPARLTPDWHRLAACEPNASLACACGATLKLIIKVHHVVG